MQPVKKSDLLCDLLQEAKSAPKCKREECRYEKQGFTVSYNPYGFAALSTIENPYFRILFDLGNGGNLREIAKKIEAKNPKYKDVFEKHNAETDTQEHISVDEFLTCADRSSYYLHIYKNQSDQVIFEIDETSFWW